MQPNSEVFQIMITNEEYTQTKVKLTNLEAEVTHYKIEYQRLKQQNKNIEQKWQRGKNQILYIRQHLASLRLSVLRLSKRLLCEDDKKEKISRQNKQLAQRLQQKEETIQLKDAQIKSKITTISQLSKKIEAQSNQILHFLNQKKQFIALQLQIQQLKEQLQEKDILIINERQILSHRQKTMKQNEQKFSIAMKSIKDFGASIECEDQNQKLRQKNSRLKKKISELNDRLEWITNVKLREVNELGDLEDYYKQILGKTQAYLNMLYYSLNGMEDKQKRQRMQEVKTVMLYEIENRCQNLITNN